MQACFGFYLGVGLYIYFIFLYIYGNKFCHVLLSNFLGVQSVIHKEIHIGVFLLNIHLWMGLGVFRCLIHHG